MLSGALAGDFRFALRMIRRAPTFAATVVLTVTIAIAANATIFTVVNAVMARRVEEPLDRRGEARDGAGVNPELVERVEGAQWKPSSVVSGFEPPADGR